MTIVDIIIIGGLLFGAFALYPSFWSIIMVAVAVFIIGYGIVTYGKPR